MDGQTSTSTAAYPVQDGDDAGDEDGDDDAYDDEDVEEFLTDLTDEEDCDAGKIAGQN